MAVNMDLQLHERGAVIIDWGDGTPVETRSILVKFGFARL